MTSKLVIAIIISLIAVIPVNAYELSNGKTATKVGNSKSEEILQEDTSEIVINIDANEEAPLEIETEEFVNLGEVIKINLDVAKVAITLAFIAIVIGGVLSFKIENPYNLPTIIKIPNKKKYIKHKSKQNVLRRAPLQGNVYMIYLLALQAGLISQDTIYKMVGIPSEQIRQELITATNNLANNGRIKYIFKYKKLKVYKLTKFGEEDIYEIVNFINYIEFAVRNNKLRDNEQLFQYLIK